MKIQGFNRWTAILLTVITVMFSASCAKYQNRDNAMQLRNGMTKEEVLKIMGEPIRGKPYCTPDIWFYYVETKWWWDFQSTRDECLPVVFKDGKIVGWGVEYYKRNVLYPINQE